jgi:hypothetical protein
LDGPAIIDSKSRTWCRNGAFFREDGPAYESNDGNKRWYKNGALHRIDGPAVIYPDGTKSWCLRGIAFKNKEDFFLHLSEEEKRLALFSEDFLNG